MKIGDLVTRKFILREEPEVKKETLGIIVEWEPDYREYSDGNTEGCGWVKWSTRNDFSIEYEMDLELVNEGR